MLVKEILVKGWLPRLWGEWKGALERLSEANDPIERPIVLLHRIHMGSSHFLGTFNPHATLFLLQGHKDTG
jgi:hypothetical protein